VTSVTLEADDAAVDREAMNGGPAPPNNQGKGHCFYQEASMRVAARLVSLVALLVTYFCCPAGASDYEVGKSLVCDTQGQVERFVALFTGDASAAIRVVNAESKDPTACAIVNVAYMRGPSIGMARHRDNAFEIVRVLVVGVETERGIRPVSSASYFSLFGVKEYAI
jgi:hypothetical protein